jgi:hypothetical protein
VSRLLALLMVLGTLLSLGACSAAGASSSVRRPGSARHTDSPPPAPVPLTVSGFRSSGVIISGGVPAPYNYAPSVLDDHGRVSAWWCSQVPGVGQGDDILYASAPVLTGPFTADGGAPAVPVFAGQPGGFDAKHTCDPSVVKVGPTYYLYYTGTADDHTHGNAIGVASSTDGLAWRRENGGKPIVTASGTTRRANVYGAGQPSALYLDGWFYLMFTDTTAVDAQPNGAGQFVLRAKNPEFTEQVQSLTASGFRPAGQEAPRSIVDAFSADWMWVDALEAFAVAHQVTAGTEITFWNRDFTGQPYRPVLIPGPWQEGPGLVRAPDGHATVSTSDPCGVVPVGVFRATALNPAPTDIRYFGVDITGVNACTQPATAAAVLDGFAVPSPRHTVEILHDGTRVELDRLSVARLMVPKVIDDWISAVNTLPVAGVIHSYAPAFRAPWGEVALEDNRGRLWTVPPGAAEANGAPIVDLTQQQWNRYQHGNLAAY